MSDSLDRIIEEELNRPSIFKSRESLMPEYIPEKLPHRAEEFRSLVSYFKHLISEPGSISQRVLVTGSVGTGKTALTRLFGRTFTRYAQEKNVNVRYVHVNCHKNRTLYNVLFEIAMQLDLPIPSRGLSSKEMLDLIISQLSEKMMYVIVALDDFHYFASIAGKEAVYFIARTYDAYEGVKHLNFIFITSDTSKLSLLDSVTEGYLLKHYIKLKPYTSQQLYDILKYRASLSFYEGTYSDEVLRTIAEYEGVDSGGSGNARHALEILSLAGDIAEKSGSDKITLEHVRMAISRTSKDITVISDAIRHLPLHELLILLSIIKLLKKSGKRFVRMGEVEEEYRSTCEMLGEPYRKHTQVYEYVQNLAKLGIIHVEPSGKGFRGKSTMISIHHGPLEALEKHVNELIQKKRELGL